MQKLQCVGDGIESCDIRTRIYVAVDISRSTKSLKFRLEGNKVMSYIRLIENIHLENLCKI